MNIVIAGGGKVGETLSRELSVEDNDIILIEQNADRLERIINSVDITGLVGDGGDYDNLKEARVGNCDVFIAVTPEDETNIISSIIAKKLGAKHTIARVRNPKYANHMEFIREGLGITLMINPELEAAKHIEKILEFPESLSVEPFENGRVNIVEIDVNKDSPLVNMPLSQFRRVYGDVLVITVSRQGETFIPKGDTTLDAEDRLFVTGAKRDLTKFHRKVGYKEKKIQSVLIIGGGRITYYLLRLLSKLKLDIKVIEVNQEKALELSGQFPNVVVVRGDGTDQDFLQEERIEEFDAVLSLTGIDEENIINSLYAVTLGINKVITKVSRTGLLRILGDTDLQSIVTPKVLIASKILRFVRSLKNTNISNVEALYRIADNNVEVLQFLVKNDSRVIHTELKDLNMKSDLLVAYIMRKNRLIFPSGEDTIQPGDHVIIVTTHKAFDDIDDILN